MEDAEQLTFMYGNVDNDTITIDVERYGELLEAESWVQALEAAGVDNWDGYDFAQEIYNEKG